MQHLVILGSGGLARESLEIVEAINELSLSASGKKTYNILGFVTENHDATKDINARLGILGGDEILPSLPQDTKFVSSIGNGLARARAAKKALAAGLTAETLIHPKANIAKHGVEIGAGTIIGSFADISCDVKIGSFVLIDRGVSIAHDCDIGDFASLYIGSSLAGNVTVSNQVTIGTGARVIQGINLEENAFVGAGATVIRDVTAFQKVAGNPAKEISNR